MSQAKLLIGSSQKNLRVAHVLADALEDCADITVWDEGVFGLNQGFLETLLKKLEEYDFAVFILAPDDVTTSKDETKPSPRDNVLFESGLFMGVLGRERVFLVYDQAVELKIPSDLAGITLASYDGARMEGQDAAAAVRKARLLISDNIKASRFPHLVGEWKSRYPLTFEEGSPLVDEDVEIRPYRDGVSIISKRNSHDDNYTAFGRLPMERQIIGEWKSREESSDTCGLFVLTVSPSANYMYGYFTSPDETGGVTYATWVLAKKAGGDETRTNGRLKQAQDILTSTTIGLSSPSSGS
jgi:hypothetical protein